MDDVKAAFRVFDHNNDGSISKDELKEAMVNFGTRCTDELVKILKEKLIKMRRGHTGYLIVLLLCAPAKTTFKNILLSLLSDQRYFFSTELELMN